MIIIFKIVVKVKFLIFYYEVINHFRVKDFQYLNLILQHMHIYPFYFDIRLQHLLNNYNF